jgi:hypothetical protein
VEVVRIKVRKGEIVEAGSWLYVWRRTDDGGVMYVGSTATPPALRTWLHLHGDDPAVARVRHRYEGALEGDFEVVAFRLPDHASRREAKDELIRQLDDSDMLAASYVGDRPQRGHTGLAEESKSVVNPMLRHLRERSE